MEETIYVRVEKLEERTDAYHPNNIPTGDVRYGSFTSNPTVGEPFLIQGISLRQGYRGFRTSTVQEVLSENTFKTYNSVYKWEIIPVHEVPGFNKFGERLTAIL